MTPPPAQKEQRAPTDFEARVSDLRSVLQLSRELGASTELMPLLQQVETAALSVIGCERATVFILDHDSNELYSRVGTGGPLTHDGAIQVAEQMNRKRDVHVRVDLLLESDHAEVLIGFIDLLYEKALAKPD